MHEIWHYGLIAASLFFGSFWLERLASHMGGKQIQVDNTDMVLLVMSVTVFTLLAREYRL